MISWSCVVTAGLPEAKTTMQSTAIETSTVALALYPYACTTHPLYNSNSSCLMQPEADRRGLPLCGRQPMRENNG